jgi:hypothetical protein
MRTRATLLVALMLLLAGCAGTSVPAAGPVVPRTPAELPLQAGWPDGLHSPLPVSMDLPSCEDGSGPPPDRSGTERLSAHWGKRARGRQLTTYDDRAEATAAARRLAGYYRRCPVTTSRELPWTTTTTVRSDTVGDESWVVSCRLDIDGTPTGATTLLVVRVGSTVLVDSAGTTFGAGRTAAARAADVVDDQRRRAAELLTAMDVLRG